MSSQQFVETLKLIGYPKADSLSARALDWMFENEAALPLLSWFCSTVGPQNVLTLEEKTAYEELEKSGEGVLEGTQLDEALACLSSGRDEDVSLDTLREDLERMKQDAERHRRRKQKLVQARNKLSLHHTGLTHRLSRLGDAEQVSKQQYKNAMDDCRKAGAENTDSLERLLLSVRRLLALYQDYYPSDISTSERHSSVFLSQHRLDALFLAEEKYTKELTSFTKKQFFEGIADIAGGELSRYELLKVSNPMSLLVKGQSHETFRQDCEELSRLQTVFPKSESERLNALAEEKCHSGALQQAEFVLRMLQSGSFPKTSHDIGEMLQETNTALAAKRQELQRLTKQKVPALVEELAMLQGTTVLTGDYHLKLARQDYFVSNQDQVIKYLVDQRARNEFLTMAYEIEHRNHRDIHRLLTAAQQTLGDRLSSLEERMKVMADPAVTKARYERGTVDTRDVGSTCLHRLLVPVDEATATKQLFLSYSKMVEAAEALKQKHGRAKAEAVSTADRYCERIKQLEKEVCRCEHVLYAESSTVGGPPILTPRAVQEAMTELDNLLQKLEAAILDTITDMNNKKKSMKNDVLQTKERELFTYFHLHPDRLRTNVERLEQRLQAQSVS